MRILSLFVLLAIGHLSSFAQDHWVGIYLFEDGDKYELISISKRDGCYDLSWGSGSVKFPLKMEKKPVNCEGIDQANFSFIVTLFGYESYEFDPISWDENKRVMEFDILGFDEPMVFRRLK